MVSLNNLSSMFIQLMNVPIHDFGKLVNLELKSEIMLLFCIFWKLMTDITYSLQFSTLFHLWPPFQSLHPPLPTPLCICSFFPLSSFPSGSIHINPLVLEEYVYFIKNQLFSWKCSSLYKPAFLLWLVPMVMELGHRMPQKDYVKYTQILRQTSYLTKLYLGHHFHSVYTQLHNSLQQWLIRVHSTSLELSSIPGLHAMTIEFYSLT